MSQKLQQDNLVSKLELKNKITRTKSHELFQALLIEILLVCTGSCKTYSLRLNNSMICQTVSKKHKAAGFPLTEEPLTLTFLSKLYLVSQIKLPLSNGKEILLILNILDKAFKTDTV